MEYSKKDYQGSPSTLCKGCGHDGITASIVRSLTDLQIDPKNLIKLSGIGCSSKIPNYFSDQSFGFNSVHGRMANLATGVHIALPNSSIIGVSGDGDTGSIGLSGFLHMIRRNINITYIIADNGVYGLTKGQFSATSLSGDQLKKGAQQELPEMNLPLLALSAGCEFLARGFAGNQTQLKDLLSAGLLFKGTAIIDVVSPCVIYGNHEGYSRSYQLNQEQNVSLNEIDLIEERDEIQNRLPFEIKPLESNYDPTSLETARSLLSKERQENHLHTGVIYCNKSPRPCLVPDTPNAELKLTQASRVSSEKFNQWQQSYAVS